MECSCFYFEKDENDEDDICTCGHNLDEHDEDFDCKADYVEMDSMPQEKVPGPGRRPVERTRPAKYPAPPQKEEGTGDGGVTITPPKKDK